MTAEVSQDILEAFVFANTPSYLYKRLLASGGVKKLSQLPSDVLAELISSASPNDVNSIANAYAALVAFLSKGEKSDVDFASLINGNLAWGERFVDFHKKNTRSTSISSVTMSWPAASSADKKMVTSNFVKK